MVCKRGGSLGGGIGIPMPMGMPIMTFPMLGGSLALLELRELTREERGYRGATGQQDCNIHEEAVHVPPLSKHLEHEKMVTSGLNNCIVFVL